MSEVRHTPGPWAANWNVREGFKEEGVMGWHVHTADDAEPDICVIPDEERLDGSSRAANARLIAAAPALLAALQTMSQLWHAYVMPEHYDGHAAKAYQEALDAIRKATKGD